LNTSRKSAVEIIDSSVATSEPVFDTSSVAFSELVDDVSTPIDNVSTPIDDVSTPKSSPSFDSDVFRVETGSPAEPTASVETADSSPTVFK
jgi:hypothetical protein